MAVILSLERKSMLSPENASEVSILLDYTGDITFVDCIIQVHVVWSKSCFSDLRKHWLNDDFCSAEPSWICSSCVNLLYLMTSTQLYLMTSTQIDCAEEDSGSYSDSCAVKTAKVVHLLCDQRVVSDFSPPCRILYIIQNSV